MLGSNKNNRNMVLESWSLSCGYAIEEFKALYFVSFSCKPVRQKGNVPIMSAYTQVCVS